MDHQITTLAENDRVDQPRVQLRLVDIQRIPEPDLHTPLKADGCLHLLVKARRIGDGSIWQLVPDHHSRLFLRRRASNHGPNQVVIRIGVDGSVSRS